MVRGPAPAFPLQRPRALFTRSQEGGAPTWCRRTSEQSTPVLGLHARLRTRLGSVIGARCYRMIGSTPPPPVSEGGFHQNQRVQAPCRSACKRAEGASEASSDLWR